MSHAHLIGLLLGEGITLVFGAVIPYLLRRKPESITNDTKEI